MIRCPGQDQRFWKPEDIFEVPCGGCGNSIEFFKDEPKLKCHKCGQIVINPKINLGCAEWCNYAEQCLGVDSVQDMKIMRDELINEMKNYFNEDERRIEHALAVLNYAEQIQNTEGGDQLVIRAAAIFHDIGIHEAERKYGSTAGRYQEIEGPPIAESILKKYNIPAEVIKHICRIIANHHSAKDIDTIEFRIIWDADWLVNMSLDFRNAKKEELKKIINKVFRTDDGNKIAKNLFLKKAKTFH
jgi:putative nucleotidyltransferase with HDIG domain